MQTNRSLPTSLATVGRCGTGIRNGWSRANRYDPDGIVYDQKEMELKELQILSGITGTVVNGQPTRTACRAQTPRSPQRVIKPHWESTQSKSA